ncbi:MAG: N-acetyl-alpha-D-glucosaminyl L-malate synthase [Planctomycetes bacterium]|nr:N-acetyl-alpha-D-glucosaminyl L-malate synthase [Planctomycetota bacterium]
MRVGIVCHPTYGGSGAVAVAVARALGQAGHDVHVLSYEQPARLPAGATGVTFHRVGVTAYPLFRYPPYDLALASAICEIAERNSLDIVHVHYAIPHAVAALLARAMLGSRLRVVTTLHGTDITIVGVDASYHRPTLFGLEGSDAVTAVSAWLRDETRRFFRFDRAIDVVPNSVDAACFRPDPAARRDFARDDEFVVVHVSNMRPVKRVHDVVAAFAAAFPRGGGRLLLAGDGPDRAGAEERARAAGVADRVEFLGETESVERVHAAADAFLLASESESFGLAALEASACGVPVVATRVGGVPEVVEDGVTGLLVPPGDPGAAAGALRRLAEDRPFARSLGASGRRRAVERFGEDAVLARYVAIYERVLAG